MAGICQALARHWPRRCHNLQSILNLYRARHISNIYIPKIIIVLNLDNICKADMLGGGTTIHGSNSLYIV